MQATVDNVLNEVDEKLSGVRHLISQADTEMMMDLLMHVDSSCVKLFPRGVDKIFSLLKFDSEKARNELGNSVNHWRRNLQELE